MEIAEKTSFLYLGYELNLSGEDLSEKSSSIVVEKLLRSMKEGKENPNFFSEILPILGKYATFLAKKMGLPGGHFLGATDFRQSSKTTIDLEALSSLSLEEFITRYRDLVLQKETLLQSPPYGN